VCPDQVVHATPSFLFDEIVTCDVVFSQAYLRKSSKLTLGCRSPRERTAGCWTPHPNDPAGIERQTDLLAAVIIEGLRTAPVR